MELSQSFHYYDAMEGNNEEFRNRSSGAYIFRPKNASARNFVNSASYEVHTGNDLTTDALEDWNLIDRSDSFSL